MVIKTFKLEADKITVVVEHTTEPTTVTLTDMYAVDTVMPLVGTVGQEFTYELLVTQPDGVFTVTAVEDVNTATASVSRTYKGTAFLLHQTLNGEYEYMLVQELEALPQLVLAGEIAAAEDLYSGVVARVEACSIIYAPQLAGISIWIVNEDFIVQ